MRKVEVKVCVAFLAFGAVQMPGTVVELDEPDAKNLVATGMATLVVHPDASLQRPKLVPARLSKAGLAEYTKAQLLELAAELHITVPAGANKAQLIELVAAEELAVPGDDGEDEDGDGEVV